MDSQLIERARAGDLAAFDMLVATRIEGMLRTATAIVGDPDDAREATQEALLSIWRELPSLRAVDRFEAWAGAILVNRCRLMLRRARRRIGRELSMDGTGAEIPERAGPSDPMGPGAALAIAFERLDAAARSLLVLHHLDGLGLQAIADQLGIPVGTVKSRLFTARAALERELEADR